MTFEDSKVLADLDFVARTGQGRAPAVLALNEKAMNKDDIATADAGNLFVVFGGVFGGTPAQGLKETVLLHSSKDSELVDPMMARMSGEEIATSFKPSGIEYPLAIRLSGKFKTAFPEGKPKPPEAEPNEKKEEAPAPETVLKESKQETTVVLVGDSDMIQDRVAVRQSREPVRPAIVHAGEWQPGLCRKLDRSTDGRQQPDRRPEPGFARAALHGREEDAGRCRGKLPEQDQGARG